MNDDAPHAPDDDRDWDSALEAAYGAGDEDDVRISVAFRVDRAHAVRLRDIDDRSATGEVAAEGEQIGRLRVLGEIARGGIGVILRAFDPDLGREVAIKRLREEHRDDRELVRRFLEEAQIASQLQHPDIVPVYELGLDLRRRPFFAMRLVAGRTFAALLAERTDPAQDLHRFVGVFRRVCDALAYAHTRGVVHRDVKPANVMVGRFGEVQIMDWGFAKVLDRESADPPLRTIRSERNGGSSVAGAVCGTPAYMAPEQARGDSAGIDARADVFALGAILCELLTGQPPFPGRTGIERAAAADLAEALERLAACPADAALVTLARRCLEPDPARRPADAAEVAESLNRSLEAAAARADRDRLDAAAAHASLAHERRARRLTTALSAAVLAFVVLGGWWYLWHGAEVEGRARRLEAAIAAAADLAAAADYEAARTALERAAAIAEEGGGGEAAARVATLVAEVDRSRRVHELETAIFRLRVEPLLSAGVTHRYSEAFGELGLELDGEPGTVAAALGGDQTTVPSLIGALDDWAMRALATQPGRLEQRLRSPVAAGQLVAVARELDRDPGRDAIREAAIARDPARLRDAADAIRDDTDPATLELAALACVAIGDRSAATEILERGCRAQPDEFWLNYRLSQLYSLQTPPWRGEAERHLILAMTLHDDPDWRPPPQTPGRPAFPFRRGRPGALIESVTRLVETGDFRRALVELRRAASARQARTRNEVPALARRALERIGADDHLLRRQFEALLR